MAVEFTTAIYTANVAQLVEPRIVVPVVAGSSPVVRPHNTPGMVAFILHTHLPYVLHPGTWPHGSDWLYEAICECYLPLIQMCDRLLADGIRPGLSIDVSPVLLEQLAHPDLPELFEDYCAHHAVLARADADRFQQESNEDSNETLAALALQWSDWYEQAQRSFTETYDRDVVGALRRLQNEGAIELMTCGLTHGYLPLIAEDTLVEAQIDLAVQVHRRHFGKLPAGIWLPECAYRPAYHWQTLLPHPVYSTACARQGMEQILHRHGLQFFVTDQPALSPYTLVRAGGRHHPETAVVFNRHREIALQVWSGQTGYPGDGDYLDFHKKYYRSALRYWRVTGAGVDMQDKAPYQWEWAASKAREHAAHYVRIREVTLQHERSASGGDPVIALPFDTELFGHWWFEGPIFLEHVIRGLAASDVAKTVTASEAITRQQPERVVELPESSWGRNGNHDVWMNPEVQWIWEREYQLEYRLRMFYEKHRRVGEDRLLHRLLVNAWREIFLAQSSDWPFLISTFSSKEYAEKRFYHHAEDAEHLLDLAERYCAVGTVRAEDLDFLDACERRNGIFEAELSAWADQPHFREGTSWPAQ